MFNYPATDVKVAGIVGGLDLKVCYFGGFINGYERRITQAKGRLYYHYSS
jgi:hypothetical protein